METMEVVTPVQRRRGVQAFERVCWGHYGTLAVPNAVETASQGIRLDRKAGPKLHAGGGCVYGYGVRCGLPGMSHPIQAVVRPLEPSQVGADVGPSRFRLHHLREDDLEPGYSRDQLQSRPHGALGVVLMRLRIAEVHEDTVAQIFRHKAVEATHGLGDAFLISLPPPPADPQQDETLL